MTRGNAARRTRSARAANALPLSEGYNRPQLKEDGFMEVFEEAKSLIPG